MAIFSFTTVGEAWYLVRLPESPVQQWTRDQLTSFLRRHEYTEDDIERLLEQADTSFDMQVFVPDPSAP
jgi:hypothetical protein